jgi:uncharacterized protein
LGSEPTVIVDTGPLVAFLDGADQWHRWTVRQVQTLQAPFLTCEAALAEAFYLLSQSRAGSAPLRELLARGIVEARFSFADERSAVLALMQRYANVPMSFADACLTRMSEVVDDARVFTLDSDFRVYRRGGRKLIPLIAPD